jgi:hypothetical protein
MSKLRKRTPRSPSSFRIPARGSLRAFFLTSLKAIARPNPMLAQIEVLDLV